MNAHVMQSRDIRRAEALQARDQRLRKNDSSEGSGERKHGAFNQTLVENATAARTDRGADRHLMMTMTDSRQQKIRYVGAGHEQNAGHRKRQ